MYLLTTKSLIFSDIPIMPTCTQPSCSFLPNLSSLYPLEPLHGYHPLMPALSDGHLYTHTYKLWSDKCCITLSSPTGLPKPAGSHFWAIIQFFSVQQIDHLACPIVFVLTFTERNLSFIRTVYRKVQKLQHKK